jgi:uncharacterized membrane protein
MNWDQIMGEGGVALFLVYLLIQHVVVPLVKRGGSSDHLDSSCDKAHALLTQQLCSMEEARKFESELMRTSIDKNTDAFDGLRDELHSWRGELGAYLKKGRD